MNLYFTQETLEQYGFAAADRKEADPFLAWGGKLFWFQRRKCLQMVHFPSKLTLVLVDFKKAGMDNIGSWIAHYLHDLYFDRPETLALLKRYFSETSQTTFSQLRDRKVISTLNYTQLAFLDNGQRLQYYIRDGVLNTHQLNRELNEEWVFTRKENGKALYYRSGRYFEELLKERYEKTTR